MAKKAALAKIQQIETRRLAAAARARKVAKAAWDTQQHTLLAGGAALGIGMAESRGMNLPTIDSVDPSVLYAALAFGMSVFIKNKMVKRLAEGATDGLLGVAAYKAGRDGFNSLFSYAKPTATAPAATPTAGYSRNPYGEEVIETGAF